MIVQLTTPVKSKPTTRSLNYVHASIYAKKYNRVSLFLVY